MAFVNWSTVAQLGSNSTIGMAWFCVLEQDPLSSLIRTALTQTNKQTNKQTTIPVCLPSHTQSVIYYKFGNFRDYSIFVNSVKRHIWDVKNSRLGHYLAISLNDRVISLAILREFYFHETSHLQSSTKIEPSRKFPNLQYAIFLMDFPIQIHTTKMIVFIIYKRVTGRTFQISLYISP